MKFSEAIQNWKRLSGISRKPSTQCYHNEIRKIILDRWPDHEQEIAAITPAELKTFVERVAHFSSPRFNAVINCIKSFVPAASELRSRQVRPKERQNISQLKFQELLTELDGRRQSHSGLIVRFLSLTGLRIGAAGKLRWRDVRGNYLLVPGSIMKNGKPCMIPFVAGTEDILSRLKKITWFHDDDFLLPSKSVKKALNTSCDRVGIPRLSHHDFRHMFATRCIESGVDLPTAARWLGHQDGGALLGRTYFHLCDRHSLKMAAQVKI
jgi:integrase